MIDHLGGSDRRHPDRAVWRTLPAKILPVCGTGGRCGNQRSEASSRLRFPGCSILQVCLPTCGFPHKKSPGRRDTGMQNQERKSVRRLRRSGCSFLQVCLSACVLRKKNWQENQGGCEDTEIGRGKQSAVCPVQGVRFYRNACPHAFSAQKIPRLESRGIFIRHLR